MADVDVGPVYSEASIAEAVTAAVSTASLDPSKYDTITLAEGVVVELVGAGKAVEDTAKSVSDTIYDENFYTPAILPKASRNQDGYMNITVYGTFTGTVTLQRSFNGGTTWYDVKEYTASDEDYLEDKEMGVMYRIGVKTGGWTSGSVYVRLGISR